MDTPRTPYYKGIGGVFSVEKSISQKTVVFCDIVFFILVFGQVFSWHRCSCLCIDVLVFA